MDLPVSNGMDSTLVFVDRLTKMSHFIACSKFTTAPEFTWFFVSHIVKVHGLSDSIVSDRGSIFTSNFWSTLPSILKIDPRKSTMFHLQTDGQTVRIKVIRNGSPPLAIAQPDLLSLHSDILAILMSIYSADQILDPCSIQALKSSLQSTSKPNTN